MAELGRRTELPAEHEFPGEVTFRQEHLGSLFNQAALQLRETLEMYLPAREPGALSRELFEILARIPRDGDLRRSKESTVIYQSEFEIWDKGSEEQLVRRDLKIQARLMPLAELSKLLLEGFDALTADSIMRDPSIPIISITITETTASGRNNPDTWLVVDFKRFREYLDGLSARLNSEKIIQLTEMLKRYVPDSGTLVINYNSDQFACPPCVYKQLLIASLFEYKLRYHSPNNWEQAVREFYQELETLKHLAEVADSHAIHHQADDWSDENQLNTVEAGKVGSGSGRLTVQDVLFYPKMQVLRVVDDLWLEIYNITTNYPLGSNPTNPFYYASVSTKLSAELE